MADQHALLNLSGIVSLWLGYEAMYLTHKKKRVLLVPPCHAPYKNANHGSHKNAGDTVRKEPKACHVDKVH